MKNKFLVGLGVVGAALMAAPAFAADWVTIPSFSSFQASSTDFASGVFTSLVGLTAIVVGVVIAGLILNKLIKLIVGAAKKVTGGSRRGGRRMRR